MIDRLLQLELEGFRSYKHRTTIPLDADVVVVYGPNGSGKTSLFSALEYSLTGKVAHLEAFGEDYPRSLQHIRTSEPAVVSAKFRTPNKDVRFIQRRFGDRGPVVAGDAQLSTMDAQFYRDRCYLSQAQLGRLFDTYQEADDKESDQPLVRFARELLGLDLLENISDGLHTVADVRRLDNVSVAYRRLKEARESIGREMQLIRQQLATKTAAFTNAISALEMFESANPGRPGHVEWTSTTLKQRREAIEQQRREASVEQKVHRLRRYEGRLEAALELVQSSELPTEDRQKELGDLLSTAGKRAEQLRQRLLPLVARCVEATKDIAGALPDVPSQEAPERWLHAFEERARRLLESVDMELEAADQLQKKLAGARVARDEAKTKREALSTASQDDASRLQLWLEVLQRAAAQLHGNDCPLCGRDYSEVNAGSLSARIHGELARLGADIERLTQHIALRTRTEVDYQQNLGLVQALETQYEEHSSRVSKTTEVRNAILTVVEAARDSAPLRAELSKLRNDIASLQRDSENLSQLQRRHAEVADQVATISRELEMPARPFDPPSTEAILQQVRRQAETLLEQERQLDAFLNGIVSAERASNEREETQKRLNAVEERSRVAEVSWQRVEDCIRQAKGLSTAAINAKKILLEEVFDGTLNGLWRDLFRRLVKSDRFTPQLKLTQKGRKLRTEIQGHADAVNPFGHAGSVLSAGNFNTAALSLFLSVHLLEEPRHRLLVLDDPVQNIDDVHVVQLASLLRTIVHDSRRQIVVGVHERALFEYLCLELGPTSEHQALIALELLHGADSKGTEVRIERRTWQEDKLELGA